MAHRSRKGQLKLAPLVSGNRPYCVIGFEEGKEPRVHTNLDNTDELHALLDSLDVDEDYLPFIAAIREVVDRNRAEIDGAGAG